MESIFSPLYYFQQSCHQNVNVFIGLIDYFILFTLFLIDDFKSTCRRLPW